MCGKRLKYHFLNETALYRAAMLDGYWEGMGQVYNMKDQRGILKPPNQTRFDVFSEISLLLHYSAVSAHKRG